ncbi:hypothetical protein [Duganella violaceipulchra]|uniref:Uncharacterized protein n=1 Tax=Duganella violaceipulchra TaxID=2849652 RepID=A0ABT1GNN0_9BURK|nr:hypothetical protein [Duganella violaceicalia]MCP2009143.1 hypothetical protein [Duganella violaceicalia]
MSTQRLRKPAVIALGLAATGVVALCAWAALAPLALPSRDELFEIPNGTWARRMAGDKVEILPAEIRLTQGANDVLLLRNKDSVPQIFGPVLIMPGQSFRLPFETVSVNDFACTAHASGQMRVVVDAMPSTGWPRLKWRALRAWARAPHMFST